jgi:hypothetical protein
MAIHWLQGDLISPSFFILFKTVRKIPYTKPGSLKTNLEYILIQFLQIEVILK